MMDPKNQAVAIHLLNSMQASLDALASILCEEQAQECSHPAERRKDFSTMGKERWICTECGFKYGMDDVE